MNRITSRLRRGLLGAAVSATLLGLQLGGQSAFAENNYTQDLDSQDKLGNFEIQTDDSYSGTCTTLDLGFFGTYTYCS